MNPSMLSPQINVAKIYRNDLIITFKLDKCSRMVSVSINMATTEGIKVTEGPIADVQEVSIPKRQEVATKNPTTAKYRSYRWEPLTHLNH